MSHSKVSFSKWIEKVCRDRSLHQATFKGNPWCLEKENVTSIIKEGQGERFIELQTSKSPPRLWEDNRENPPWNPLTSRKDQGVLEQQNKVYKDNHI